MKRFSIFILAMLSVSASYSQAGTPDSSFDADGKLQVAPPGGLVNSFGLPGTVLIQPDGKIVACATVNNGGNTDFIVFRFNSNGTADNSFDGDGMVITNITVNDNLFRIAL